MYNLQDLSAAGCLLQWALRPRARPTTDVEYRQLLERYLDSLPFREIVCAIAEGLGLQVVEVSSLGMVLAATGDSVFTMTATDYRSSTSADDRLLEGLVQIAIAATVFPRAQDLEEDPTIARPAITAEEVEATLRDICARLEETSSGQPDPSLEAQTTGLYEAWRVYHDKASAKTTSGTRASPATTTRFIERGLEFLQHQGCFIEETRRRRRAYRPTWRYQVMVQEWSASRMYEIVRALLEGKDI